MCLAQRGTCWMVVMLAITLAGSLRAQQNRPDPLSTKPSKTRSPALTSLHQLEGTFIEVLRTDTGFKKTARCNAEDQLIVKVIGSSLSLSWGAGSQARRFEKASIAEGQVTLVDRRRTIQVRRVSEQVISLTFLRAGKPHRSYLYGNVDMAIKLPLAQKGEGGCTF